MLDDRIAKLGAFDLLRAIHQTGKVVGNGLGFDSGFHALHDQISSFGPAHVAQHHLAGEDHAAGVDNVLAGVLGRGAVGGLEDGVTGHVVDVRAGGDADPADLSGQGVAEVVPVEVQGGDHVVVGGAQQDLLEEVVGDDVLDDDEIGRASCRERV